MHQLNGSSTVLYRYLPNLAKSPVTRGKLGLHNTLYLLFLNSPNKRKQAWRAIRITELRDIVLDVRGIVLEAKNYCFKAMNCYFEVLFRTLKVLF